MRKTEVKTHKQHSAFESHHKPFSSNDAWPKQLVKNKWSYECNLTHTHTHIYSPSLRPPEHIGGCRLTQVQPSGRRPERAELSREGGVRVSSCGGGWASARLTEAPEGDRLTDASKGPKWRRKNIYRWSISFRRIFVRLAFRPITVHIVGFTIGCFYLIFTRFLCIIIISNMDIMIFFKMFLLEYHENTTRMPNSNFTVQQNVGRYRILCNNNDNNVPISINRAFLIEILSQ